MNGMEIVIPNVVREYSQMTLPDVQDMEYFLSRKNRIFYVEGVIYRDADTDYSQTAELAKTIINLNIEDIGIPKEQRKPIIILIDSPGGEIDQSFILIDVIQSSVTPVYTIALSSAMSGGFLILLAGHKKFVFPHSQLLVHQGRAEGISGTPDEIIAATRNYKDTISRMKDFILANSKIDPKVFAKNQKKDWFISPTQAVSDEFGIADKIITDLSEVFGGWYF